MLSKDKIQLQELLAHPAWQQFKGLLLVDNLPEYRSLKTKLQADQDSASRAGDAIKAAYALGAKEILNVVLDIPDKYLKGNFGTL